MNNAKSIITVLAIIFLLVGFVTGYLSRMVQDQEEFGSVNITNEYQATTTVAITGTTYKAAQTRHLIKAATYGSVTLGSVTVASTTQNIMSIYNATSSAAVVDGTYGTLITTLPVGLPQGTYTFDAELNAGLVVDLASGFGGDYVITFR